MKKVLAFIGFIISFVFPNHLIKCFHVCFTYIYTGYKKRLFGGFWENSVLVPKSTMLVGLKNVYVGKNCIMRAGIQLTAYNRYKKYNTTVLLYV